MALPTVAEAMSRWQPGSAGWDWTAEAHDLWTREPAAMRELKESIRLQGLRPAAPDEEPIILGSDGRVWSGHHRLVAAYAVDPDMRLPEGTEVYT